MTQENRNHDLESAARAVRSDQPSIDEVHEAGARIWQSLQGAAGAQEMEPIRGCEDVTRLLPAFGAKQLSPERMLLVRSHLHECANCRARAAHRSAEVKWTPVVAMRPARRWSVFAVAAAVVVIAATAFVVNNMYFAVPAGARATVQSVDGTAYRVMPDGELLLTAGAQLNEGEIMRTAAGSHAYVKLSDGSLVEVNERTSFAVKARGKDMTIALDQGAVIIQAPHRDSGHLYVKTPDARVTDTGTVFSVNAGMKGSRVSVVEGSVEVAGGGRNEVLHAGEQVSTSANMEPIPVEQDIAWSRDRVKHLELLAQFSQLQKKLAQVQLPAPRYSSELLNRMPADAVVYASLPNAGQALEEANKIFQDQLQQSDALRQWWAHGDPNASAKLNETIAKIRQLSDYLGDEVVIVGFSGAGKEHGGAAVVATIRRSGLQDFLQNHFTSEDGKKVTIVDESQLASLPATFQGPVALVRQNEVVFSGSRGDLERVNAALNSGGGLTQTEFGQRIAEAYSHGAGFLLAVDLHKAMSNGRQSAENKARKDAELARSGFGDMRYLIVEHRELNNVPENRMSLDFARERRGIASWLAAPAPMGSLEFVNRNAAVAVAFIAKDPQLMLTDILNMSGNRAKQQSEVADLEASLNLRIREDLAAHFGGDGAFALDGPVLPTPAWKMVIEVHDEAGLAESLQKLASGINAEAQHKGKPGIELRTEEVSGQRYYAIHPLAPGAPDVYYTFNAGYMILGPDRATLMNTIRTRANGDSLARSGEFKSMLPKDENANYSLIAYQNLTPILQPLSSQLTGDQAKIIQQLAADSRPTVACAWGKQDRIEAVTNSRLLGYDWLALGTLLEKNKGTKQPQRP
jgi:hypothetical protein